ncbi:MAG: T9SS type A sorting domain-containing protein, partial [Bacteroidales bacterium]|nr:T9SS type A sorting domain-containing protein [Bacteroidales bacterium]
PPEELGNVWRIFDGRLSYSKGALLLHMIRFELQDDDLFFDVLKTYVEEYGDSVATGDDFREWLEQVSGKDFTDFFNQWYYGEGYPIFDITWNQSGSDLHISSTQTGSTSFTPLFTMLVPYHLTFADGSDTTILLYQDNNLNSYTIPISGTVMNIELDPEQWILHKLNTLSVGLEETGNPVHFTIGPNPARGHFSIFFSHPSEEELLLSISDLTGRKVYEEPAVPASGRIDISGIRAGIYLVSLTNGESRIIKKLIIE